MPLVFSYGSNSTAQLRARVGNPALQSRGARLPDFARVFCLRSGGWGGGGVASIAPAEGRTVYGAVVELSDDEKLALDGYEGGYRSHGLEAASWTTVNVVEKDGQMKEAVVYVAGSGAGGYTTMMAVPPSEQYLTAIHCMLREHWGMDGETVDVCSYEADDGTVSEPTLRWRHPGAAALSLEALCVEVSTRRSTPWEMPRTIQEVMGKLESIGVRSTAQLAEVLRAGTLNEQLRAAGATPFGKETVQILQSLLLGDALGEVPAAIAPVPAGAAAAGELMFVYGSLLSGLHNHFRLEGQSKLLGAARTVRSDYTMVTSEGSGFPFTLPPGEGRADCTPTAVLGELYQAVEPGEGSALVRQLDALESHPDWYRREKVQVELVAEGQGQGQLVEAWMYLFRKLSDLSGDEPEVKPPGDWRTFMASQ